MLYWTASIISRSILMSTWTIDADLCAVGPDSPFWKTFKSPSDYAATNGGINPSTPDTGFVEFTLKQFLAEWLYWKYGVKKQKIVADFEVGVSGSLETVASIPDSGYGSDPECGPLPVSTGSISGTASAKATLKIPQPVCDFGLPLNNGTSKPPFIPDSYPYYESQRFAVFNSGTSTAKSGVSGEFSSDTTFSKAAGSSETNILFCSDICSDGTDVATQCPGHTNVGITTKTTADLAVDASLSVNAVFPWVVACVDDATTPTKCYCYVPLTGGISPTANNVNTTVTHEDCPGCLNPMSGTMKVMDGDYGGPPSFYVTSISQLPSGGGTLPSGGTLKIKTVSFGDLELDIYSNLAAYNTASATEKAAQNTTSPSANGICPTLALSALSVEITEDTP